MSGIFISAGRCVLCHEQDCRNGFLCISCMITPRKSSVISSPSAVNDSVESATEPFLKQRSNQSSIRPLKEKHNCRRRMVESGGISTSASTEHPSSVESSSSILSQETTHFRPNQNDSRAGAGSPEQVETPRGNQGERANGKNGNGWRNSRDLKQEPRTLQMPCRQHNSKEQESQITTQESSGSPLDEGEMHEVKGKMKNGDGFPRAAWIFPDRIIPAENPSLCYSGVGPEGDRPEEVIHPLLLPLLPSFFGMYVPAWPPPIVKRRKRAESWPSLRRHCTFGFVPFGERRRKRMAAEVYEQETAASPETLSSTTFSGTCNSQDASVDVNCKQACCFKRNNAVSPWSEAKEDCPGGTVCSPETNECVPSCEHFQSINVKVAENLVRDSPSVPEGLKEAECEAGDCITRKVSESGDNLSFLDKNFDLLLRSDELDSENAIRNKIEFNCDAKLDRNADNEVYIRQSIPDTQCSAYSEIEVNEETNDNSIDSGSSALFRGTSTQVERNNEANATCNHTEKRHMDTTDNGDGADICFTPKKGRSSIVNVEGKMEVDRASECDVCVRKAPMSPKSTSASPIATRQSANLARICQGLLVSRSSLGRGSGLGLYAARWFEKRQRISQYSGIMIDRNTAMLLRMMNCATHIIKVEMQHLYLLGYHTPAPLLGGGAFVNDGRWRKGGGEGPGVSVVFKVAYDRHKASRDVFIVARKDIKPGDELLTSYDNDYWKLNE